MDEHLQNRHEREQKILRYKYSKALRRRALWDVEGTNPRSEWQVARRWIRRRLSRGDGLSTSCRMQAEVQEPGEDDHPFTRPMENQYSEEFAKFRAAVDKDPFGAVFGRRLESPPTSNNSSWTSLSWIFEPLPAKLPPTTGSSPDSATGRRHQKVQNPQTTVQDHDLGSETIPIKTTTTSTTTVTDEEYEFDPISMKKVPKVKHSIPVPQPIDQKLPLPELIKSKAPSPWPGEKKLFMSTLFAEHGVDIPVKIYKPHKVYGYTGKDTAQSQLSKKTESDAAEASKKQSESYRMQELRKLKAAKLGNAIDGTNFCDRFLVKEPEVKNNTSEKARSKASEEADDDAPLFTGTTYESKSQQIVPTTSTSAAEPRKDWLLSEGFRSPAATSEQISSTPKRPSGRQIPSQSLSRIEPALDRIQSSGTKDQEAPKFPKRVIIDEPAKDKIEDLDLLRPSDIRAQSRSARRTRLDAELNKREARQKLEEDYVSRQAEEDEAVVNIPDTIAASRKKLQDGLSNLWKRVQNQPQYSNLASTIKNMGVFQDAWKNYTRKKIIEDANEKLVFKDQALTKSPSIYSKTPQAPKPRNDTFTPSNEVLEAERERQRRTLELKSENELAKKKEAQQKAQAAELAAEIRNAYESQYGSIDINHRQQSADRSENANTLDVKPVDLSEIQPQAPSTDMRNPQGQAVKAASADTAQKAQHTALQTEINRMWDEVRTTRRSLHEVSLQVRAIREGRPPTYWNTLITENSSRGFRAAIAEQLAKSQVLEAQTSPVSENASKSEGIVTDDKLKHKAAEEIGAYTASVVAANKAAARAQAVQDMRARRTNQVQAMEKEAVEASAEKVTVTDSKRMVASKKQMTDAEVSKPEIPVAASTLTSSTPSVALSPAAQQAPAFYKILAYDSSSLQIYVATTTSSLSASTSGNSDLESPLHPTDVLSRLNNPAKFLPYFQGLQDQGYEIVSGSGDILVFKKVRDAVAGATTNSVAQTVTEAAQSTEKPMQKEGPTVVENFSSKPAPAPTTSPIVRRQEDVFSGSGQSWHQEEASSDTVESSEGAWFRIKRGIRRVFFTGLAIGGVAYAIGAVAEAFGAQQPMYEERGRNGRAGIYSTESSR